MRVRYAIVTEAASSSGIRVLPVSGASPSTLELEVATLADLVIQAAREVSCEAPAVDGEDAVRRFRFGRQIDVRAVHDQADRENPAWTALHSETVAAYVAKYATKAAADLGAGDTGTNPHLRRLRMVTDRLAVRAGIAGRTGPTVRTRTGHAGRTCSASAATTASGWRLSRSVDLEDAPRPGRGQDL